MRARDLAPQPVGDLAGAFLFGSFSARSTSQDRSPYCAELLKWLFCVYNTRGFAAIMFASYFAAHQPTFALFDKHLTSIPSDTFDSFIRCHTIQFLLLLFHYRIFNSLFSQEPHTSRDTPSDYPITIAHTQRSFYLFQPNLYLFKLQTPF